MLEPWQYAKKSSSGSLEHLLPWEAGEYNELESCGPAGMNSWGRYVESGQTTYLGNSPGEATLAKT